MKSDAQKTKDNVNNKNCSILCEIICSSFFWHWCAFGFYNFIHAHWFLYDSYWNCDIRVDTKIFKKSAKWKVAVVGF